MQLSAAATATASQVATPTQVTITKIQLTPPRAVSVSYSLALRALLRVASEHVQDGHILKVTETVAPYWLLEDFRKQDLCIYNHLCGTLELLRPTHQFAFILSESDTGGVTEEIT